MTRAELSHSAADWLEDCLALMDKKNNDYADPKDALSNFREFGSFGVIVRMGDKWNRIKNITKNQKVDVKDESIQDSLMDMINYCVICLVMMVNDNE